MSDDTVLQVSTSRGVATLTLDSPANRNALSRAMRAQLRTALAGALADDAVRVVVLDHTGRVFCSGMDLTEAAGGAAGDQGGRELPELLETVWRSPKPVVAVLRGPADADRGCSTPPRPPAGWGLPRRAAGALGAVLRRRGGPGGHRGVPGEGPGPLGARGRLRFPDAPALLTGGSSAGASTGCPCPPPLAGGRCRT